MKQVDASALWSDIMMIPCKDCVWFAPVDSNPTAQKIHDILDSGNEVGICRKLTYTEDRPVLTRPDGYCHRAERREADE